MGLFETSMQHAFEPTLTRWRLTYPRGFLIQRTSQYQFWQQSFVSYSTLAPSMLRRLIPTPLLSHTASSPSMPMFLSGASCQAFNMSRDCGDGHLAPSQFLVPPCLFASSSMCQS